MRTTLNQGQNKLALTANYGTSPVEHNPYRLDFSAVGRNSMVRSSTGKQSKRRGTRSDIGKNLSLIGLNLSKMSPF